MMLLPRRERMQRASDAKRLAEDPTYRRLIAAGRQEAFDLFVSARLVDDEQREKATLMMAGINALQEILEGWQADAAMLMLEEDESENV